MKLLSYVTVCNQLKGDFTVNYCFSWEWSWVVLHFQGELRMKFILFYATMIEVFIPFIQWKLY